MKRFFVVIICILFYAITYAGEANRVTGRVVDFYGEPIIGASILVKGTTNGTISDLDGCFTLDNVQMGDIIEISYIGYVTEEIEVTPANTYIRATLREDNWSFDILSEPEQEKSINEYIEKLYVLTKNDSTYKNTIFLYDKKNKEIQFIPKQ